MVHFKSTERFLLKLALLCLSPPANNGSKYTVYSGYHTVSLSGIPDNHYFKTGIMWFVKMKEPTYQKPLLFPSGLL
jgi:hypothetical protein